VDYKTLVGKTIEAIFDGTMLHLREPLELPKGTRVRIILEAIEEEKPRSFLQTAKSLQLQGPPDWSTSIHHYLYSKEQAHD
jgi:predicted DNA-binding antitoxin AbrB/MazE fold protein